MARNADWHVRNALHNFPGSSVIKVQHFPGNYTDIALRKGGFFGGTFVVRSFDNGQIRTM